jgi:beta-lactamase superfamily II metal-dependent hydrolase
VLRVANAGATALLTGDMENETEVEMVKTQAGKLASEVVGSAASWQQHAFDDGFSSRGEA